MFILSFKTLSVGWAEKNLEKRVVLNPGKLQKNRF